MLSKNSQEEQKTLTANNQTQRENSSLNHMIMQIKEYIKTIYLVVSRRTAILQCKRITHCLITAHQVIGQRGI